MCAWQQRRNSKENYEYFVISLEFVKKLKKIEKN